MHGLINGVWQSDQAKIGNVAGGNYIHVEADGTFRLVGDATVWGDIQFGLTGAKVPAANAPTWTAFGANTNKYTFAVNDYLDLKSEELKHSYFEGTDLYPHMHIYTNGLEGTDKYLKFEVYIGITNLNAAYSEATVTSGELLIPASTADKTHLHFLLGTITGTSFLYGADITVAVKRIAAAGTAPVANPFVSQFGIHFKMDTQGSREALTK